MSPWRRIRVGLTVLAIVITVGTIGYVLIEDVALLDALYMVVITVTTVGFTEVFELSTAGQLWTMVVIALGIGVALFTAVALMEYLIDLREVRRKLRMTKWAAKQTDHIIICGYGRVGHGTLKELKKRDTNVVVIESDHAAVEAALEAGVGIIEGDATHNDILEAAGIAKARVVIACVADDSDNLVIALSSKAIRPDIRVICRATEVESERKLLLAGADAVVAPQAVGAERLALMATQPEIARIFDVVLDGSPIEFHIEELDVDAKCPVVGMTIKESGVRQESGALILAVKDRDKAMLVNPAADTRLDAGNRLVLVGTRDQVAKAASILEPIN